MLQPSTDIKHFRLGRKPYMRNTLLGWLLLGWFLFCISGAVTLIALLLPTYAHAFTPYLKWQDMLVAVLGYVILMSLGGTAMVARFLYALHVGYTCEMLTLTDDTSLAVRDLSHKNLSSIFWVVSTTFTCFLTALVGLVPEMLIGWTLGLSNPILAILGTGGAIVLSIAGLAITIPVLSILVVAWVSCVSFCRKMGSAETYRLHTHTSLMIHGFALSILSPGKAESVIELDLLEAEDQRLLLNLLRERWIDSERPWNPELGSEIQAALEEAEQLAVLV